MPRRCRGGRRSRRSDDGAARKHGRYPRGGRAPTSPTRSSRSSPSDLTVTDAEKVSRRQKVKEKRRRRGKKARPLPSRRSGADQPYKEFKIVAFRSDGDRCREGVAAAEGQGEATTARQESTAVTLEEVGRRPALQGVQDRRLPI